MRPTKPPSSDDQTTALPDVSKRAPVHQAETMNPTPAHARATVPPEKAAKSSPASASRSWSLPEQLPATFGRYQIVRLLGQGGMGTVYLAHDTQLDRQVALKIPQFSATDGPSVMERFFREARAAATLHHANICPVHDVGEINGTQYLTMAYIEGRPLAQLIRPNMKPLTPRQAATLIRKLALALDEAHSRKVIHRDLKPSNVMLTKRGEPVIMDFGLARRGGAKDAPLTQYGSIMGTPAYMAPEQAKGNPDQMGPACDIYSLGVILYELLAGRPPFEGDAIAVLSQVLMDTPKPPSKYRPDVDRKLEAICLKAMAKRPESRYPSMHELAGVLGEYLKTTSQPPPPQTTTAARTQPTTEQPLAELLRELESPDARSIAAPDFHISKSGGRIQRSEEVDLTTTVTILRTGRSVGRNRKISPRIWIAGAAGAAALLLVGIVILVRTEYGTIQIELSDPTAKVEVKVDGDTVEITGLGQPLRLKPGAHNILVQGKDFESYSDSFTVKQGDNPVMQVKLVPRHIPPPKPPDPITPDKHDHIPVNDPGKLVTSLDDPNPPPADAKTFNGHSYKFYAEELSWRQAKRRCEAIGGHPVVIESSEENAFVASLVAQAGWLDAWIGATDEAQEGIWLSVHGRPLTYTNWHSGQPSNEEHFALMSNRTFGNNTLNWQWSDQPNESKQHQPGFVCEWDSAQRGAAPPADLNRRSAEWVRLFNGSDLAGWRAVAQGNADAAQTWSVRNGVLVCSGRPNGYLHTHRSYRNYVLRFDWRYPREGAPADELKINSGCLVHIQLPHKIWPRSVEVQGLNRDHGRIFGVDGAKGTFDFNSNSLLTARRPLGEWNTTEIVCQDGAVTSNVNGVRIGAGTADLTEGPIGFQSEGAEIHFRNIEVRESGSFAANPKPEPPAAPASLAKPAGRQLVLFDGKDLSAWMHVDRQPAKWKVGKGFFVIAGGGNLMSREQFAGDHQIHVEFWIPGRPADAKKPNQKRGNSAKEKGQDRGNSGVFVQGRYEIQILDSYGSNPPTKQDCGALYGQAAPLVNACKSPGTWQSMDITFRAPKVSAQGNILVKPRLTVVLNDQTVLDIVEIEKASPTALNPAMDKPGPLMLQDHGSPVRFRNIWVKLQGS
jgi:serine/threonine protein kinase